MVQHGRSDFTDQQLLHLALVNTETNPPTSMRGGLEYADGSWARKPYMGVSPRMEIEYSGNQMIYIGHNARKLAVTSETDWIIIKRVYDASGKFIRHQVQKGEWDERAGTMTWIV